MASPKTAPATHEEGHSVVKPPIGFHIREATPEDADFVIGTFLDSWLGNYNAGPFPIHLQRPTYRETIHTLLARARARCTVVCLSENPDFVVAWALVEAFPNALRGLDQPCLHYCYVKHPYRRRQIASALITASGIDPTKPFRHTFDSKDWERVCFVYRQRGLQRKPTWIGARRDPTLVWYEGVKQNDEKPAHPIGT